MGAALTESSAYVLYQAPAPLRSKLVRRVFGKPPEGLGINFLRVSIGVSDFSVSYAPGNISYDDVDGDYDLSHFSTARADEYYLPVLQQIVAVNPDMIFVGSPWTAPLWLKDNASALGSGTLKDSDQTYETYAQYLIKFLEAFKAKGVKVAYLTLQNEPQHGDCGAMPCMTLSPAQMIRLGQTIGRRLTASAVADTKLLAYDHNWGPDEHPVVQVTNPWYLVLLITAATSVGIAALLCICNFCRAAVQRRDVSFSDSNRSGDEQGSSSSDDGWKSDKAPFVSPRKLAKRGWLTSALMTLAAVAMGIGWFCNVKATRDEFDESVPFVGPWNSIAVLESKAGSHFAGVAWHCYGGDPSAMQNVTRFYPDLEQHMTECSGGSWAPNWRDNLMWYQKTLFISNFNHNGQSTLFWNLALDENSGPRCQGGACCEHCRPVVTVPSKATGLQDITFNEEFYALGHHSAFLRPGARRISSEITIEPEQKDDLKKDIDAIAYKNVDGGVVLVVVNSQQTDSVDVEVGPEGKEFMFKLPPGVVTFTWKE
eukprot:TRINITY_DN88200_c0_g1_i1.p1 TRINITY_DN88200_c0_g1~~TRINITY_DN88200_c0_g1_i1.p1  ORF type:complete len:618 (-),score=90.04 TRINITY_DN88200_c0_g1_i1:97-1713(-)